MGLKQFTVLSITHLVVGVVGFALGVFYLPLLMEPPAPSDVNVKSLAAQASYSGYFDRDLLGSDFLHWGEGKVAVHDKHISFQGQLSPGPDYKLYLSPKFVETEAEFLHHQAAMQRVGDVNTFTNFVVSVPTHVAVDKFNTVVIWCESFGEFITAAQYQ